MHEVISPNCLSVIHCVCESRAHAMRAPLTYERKSSAPLDSQWIGEMQSAALLCAQISQWHLRRFHPLPRPFLRSYNVRDLTHSAENICPEAQPDLFASEWGRKKLAASHSLQTRYSNDILALWSKVIQCDT